MPEASRAHHYHPWERLQRALDAIPTLRGHASVEAHPLFKQVTLTPTGYDRLCQYLEEVHSGQPE
jgi:hypothetical protein